MKGAKNAPVFASASAAAVARAAESRPGSELSVIKAVPPAAEEAPVSRQTIPRSGNNFLVTQAAKQAANGLPVSRQAVQQPGSNRLRTQVINPSASAPHAAALNRQPPTPAATRVFRAPAADRAAAPAAPPPEAGNGPATTAAESPAPAASAGSEPIDLERLADEVYDIIERRLIVERERSGM
jgi:hypothetical protein